MHQNALLCGNGLEKQFFSGKTLIGKKMNHSGRDTQPRKIVKK